MRSALRRVRWSGEEHCKSHMNRTLVLLKHEPDLMQSRDAFLHILRVQETPSSLLTYRSRFWGSRGAGAAGRRTGPTAARSGSQHGSGAWTVRWDRRTSQALPAIAGARPELLCGLSLQFHFGTWRMKTLFLNAWSYFFFFVLFFSPPPFNINII